MRRISLYCGICSNEEKKMTMRCQEIQPIDTYLRNFQSMHIKRENLYGLPDQCKDIE